MAEHGLEIKQLLSGFQKASRMPVTSWSPERLYELLRLLGNDIDGLQAQITNNITAISNIVDNPEAGGLKAGGVLKRISLRI